MKKIISILSVMVLCGGITTISFADDEKTISVAKTCGFNANGKMACWQGERKAVVNGGCTEDDVNEGKACSLRGAKRAQCVKVYKTLYDKQPVPTCEAIECDKGYMMWVSGKNSMGICHKKDICTKKGKCSSDCGARICEPELIKTEIMDGRENIIKGDKYEACYCQVPVKKEEPKAEPKLVNDCPVCKITKITVTCNNKKQSVFDNLDVSFAPKTAVARDAAMVEYLKREASIAKIKKDCGIGDNVQQENVQVETQAKGVKGADQTQQTSKSVVIHYITQVVHDGNAQSADYTKIKKAQEKMEDFFSAVKSDRSVWKNADGSFNAVRLASDLTAGVVLGTVGGVVSGVLIKKSQVEKGFDALNCTVGGQKIADWGDEFRVGLRR